MMEIEEKVTIKAPKIDKTLEELQAKIKEQLSNRMHDRGLLIREFRKSEVLRLTYLALVCKNPARVHDIYIGGSFAEKKQIYRALYRLKICSMVSQIPVKSITTKKGKKTEEEKAIIKHFRDWVSKMHPTMQQHFEVKTNYWALTESGKNPDIISIVLKLDKEVSQNG